MNNLLGPAILAEVRLLMHAEGYVGVFISKIPDEKNHDLICANFLNALLSQFSELGRTIDFEMPDGTTLQLVRPKARGAGAGRVGIGSPPGP